MVEFRMTLRAKRANRQARSRLNRWRLLLEPLEERLTLALFIPQPTADLAVAQTHAPMTVAPSQATK